MTPATVEPAEFRYSVIFQPAEEGGFLVTVPVLPGLVTEGDTLEEAREMAGDAIRGYLEALAKSGEDIPIEQGEAILQRLTVTFTPA